MILLTMFALAFGGETSNPPAAAPGDAPAAAQGNAPAAPQGDAFASGADVGTDIDGDGVRDVLVFDAGQRGRRPGVWLVSGKTGAPLRAMPAHPGTIVHDARFVGDLDGDHVSDFVVTIESSDATWSWFAMSSANGKMLWKKARGAKDTAWIPLGWVGDVDGDGVRDQACREVALIRSRNGPERIRLLSGKTGESICFADVARPLGTQAFDVAVFDAGDVDLDGCAEIAMPVMFDGRASVGVYSCHLSRWLWIEHGDEHDPRFGRCVLGGRDLDGDGVPDIVVSSPSDGLHLVGTELLRAPDRIHLLSGKDGKRFDTRNVESTIETSSFGESLAFIDDVDQDKKPEILLGNGDDGMTGCVWLFASRGGPANGFVGPADGWHFGRHVVAAGDLDGDGAGDFLVTQTPQHPAQEGALIACSGATMKVLWRITRKDVDIEKPATKPTASDAVPAQSEPSAPDATSSGSPDESRKDP